MRSPARSVNFVKKGKQTKASPALLRAVSEPCARELRKSRQFCIDQKYADSNRPRVRMKLIRNLSDSSVYRQSAHRDFLYSHSAFCHYLHCLDSAWFDDVWVSFLLHKGLSFGLIWRYHTVSAFLILTSILWSSLSHHVAATALLPLSLSSILHCLIYRCTVSFISTSNWWTTGSFHVLASIRYEHTGVYISFFELFVPE